MAGSSDRHEVDVGRVRVGGDVVEQAVVAEHQVVAARRRRSRRPPHRRVRRPRRCRSRSSRRRRCPEAIVVTTPSVIGSALWRGASLAAAVIVALSPITRLRPSPASMRVAGRAADDDVVAVAGRDRVVAAVARVERRDEVEVGRVAVRGDVVQRPLSPRTRSSPAARVDRDRRPPRRARCRRPSRSGSRRRRRWPTRSSR